MRLSYYQRLFNLFRSYRRRERVVPFLPIRMWVELSNRCNLRCSMCPNSVIPSGMKGDMAWSTYQKVIDEAKDFIQDLTLHHRGESLLHPQVVQFLKYAGNKGMVTRLHTNGTLLNQKIIDGILNSGLNRISFSFDGLVKDDYESIRRGANFESVLANIQSLLRRRRELNRKHPIVALELIVLSQSHLEKNKQRQFLKQLKELKLDEFTIKQPHNWAGYLERIQHHPQSTACTFPWNALVVLFSGDVVACAQDFFATYLLGNVNEESLREIWNAPPMQRLRVGLSAREYEQFPSCKNCDRPWRKTIMGFPKEFFKKMIVRRMP